MREERGGVLYASKPGNRIVEHCTIMVIIYLERCTISNEGLGGGGLLLAKGKGCGF